MGSAGKPGGKDCS